MDCVKKNNESLMNQFLDFMTLMYQKYADILLEKKNKK